MVTNFLKYLSFEKRSSQHTITAYEEDLKQLQEFLSETFEIEDHSEVRHTHLRNWIIHLMENEMSPVSINRKIACLKSYFKFLLSREYVETNPASRLRPLKTEKRLPSFVKSTEMEELLSLPVFKGDSLPECRDRLIIELLYGTGMRLSELLGLKNTDINFFDQSIKVLGKRNKERVIPITSFVVELIKKYNNLAMEKWGTITGESALIRTDQGKPVYPMFIYRTVKKYIGEVSTLTKRSPHVLRHTFATHLLDKGADLNAVKELLGHTSLAATQVYTHNSLEKLKSAFDQAHPRA
ncbi:MAG: tyrosine-type recombinase/integrase [Cytophagales bacterium]|nr:tyrosine-type recombinase/integrase [Cytophagales bacterium]